MKNQPQKKNSVLPVVIVLIVLAGIIGTLAYLYSSSQPDRSRAANNSSSPTPVPVRSVQTIPSSAPPGAPLGVNMLGPADAPVTVEEFADLQCPSCASTNPVMKELESDFAGNRNVRFIYRHYPLPMHDKSYEAATFVEAAGMQGTQKFWAMMDQIFTNQQTWASSPTYRDLWKGYAEKIGLDVAKLEADAAGIATKNRVDLDAARARGVGVSSTPSVFLNGKLVPFSDVTVSTMKQLINAEIEAAAKPQTSSGTQSNSSNAPSSNSNSNK